MTKDFLIKEMDEAIEARLSQIETYKRKISEVAGMQEITIEELYKNLSDLEVMDIADANTIIVTVPNNWLIFRNHVEIIERFITDVHLGRNNYQQKKIVVKYNQMTSRY